MKERQVIFQAWMYKLNNIPVEEVKRQGFTAIQTSPLQYTKEPIHSNLDNAWAIYQPINYDIGNDLGTVEDLRNLADRCHANGLKLIVDIVMHHVANEKGNDISHLVPDEYRHFYYDSFININNYNDEYELTHRSLDGLPALDLQNETIIEAQFNYLIYELENSYSSLNKSLLEDTLSAEDLTYNFCATFEKPANTEKTCKNRGSNSSEYLTYVTNGCN